LAKADISIHQQQLARVMSSGSFSVREDVLFSNHKGDERSRIRKRNSKALEKLRPALERLLQPGEVVLYIARGRTPLTLIEQLTAGWWTHMLAAAAIVFTNQRILFFPVKTDGSWKESVRTALWGDVAEVKSSGFVTRNLILTYRNGQKETYLGFRPGDAKNITLIARALIPVSAGEMSVTHGAVQVCPDCRKTLTPGVYSCTSCGLTFKNEKSMILRSIFLPAGGYFYTGHPMIALLPALVEIIVLIDVLGLILVGNHDPQAPGNLGGGILLLFVFWSLETAVTILHCRRYIREYIPLRRPEASAREALANHQTSGL
jgi:hypothetical protein